MSSPGGAGGRQLHRYRGQQLVTRGPHQKSFQANTMSWQGHVTEACCLPLQADVHSVTSRGYIINGTLAVWFHLLGSEEHRLGCSSGCWLKAVELQG